MAEVYPIEGLPESSVIPLEFLSKFSKMHLLHHPDLHHGSSVNTLQILDSAKIEGVDSSNCQPLTTLIISIQEHPAVISFIGTRLPDPQKRVGRPRYNLSKKQTEKIKMRHPDDSVLEKLGVYNGVVHPILRKEKVNELKGMTFVTDVHDGVSWVALALDTNTTCIVPAEDFIQHFEDWCVTHFSGIDNIDLEQGGDTDCKKREIPFFAKISLIVEQ